MSNVAEKLAKKSSRPAQTKQVRLRLVYIDFWSILKLSFLWSIILGIITVVAAFLIWSLLNQTGVFDSVNKVLTEIAGTGSNFDINSFASLGQVMGFAIIVAILDVIVITALGAIAAVLYNLTVKITGGVMLGFTNK
ncbi:DUF3566 domain-containing protein [Subtercola boreus]|uniref:DUF3566 domain-containing protein n=1 Tax=Subtercola boreus TaxID=120213 RepID=A0A3E0WH32_9MICO|nr:DUF3566 domain-containing protein [Subtercola boreus]RFA23451.1 hypothetical protein B7R24_00700 [Subtercola boreus]RFA23844.1 hypothetical protein B7R23_00700 [Subtercola boreus]RFA29545.1 hypothetical protein B7R25_00695 [Subtercola boreus]